MKKTLFCLLIMTVSHSQAWGMDFMPNVSDACKTWKVPPRLVLAIMKHESGYRPWAVNVAGKSYQPESKAAALRIVKAAMLSKKSYDLGLMQINSAWLRKLNLTPEYVLEPHNNVTIGTWILSREIARYGLTWQAIASYHTPVKKNPERAMRYASAIIKNMKFIR